MYNKKCEPFCTGEDGKIIGVRNSASISGQYVEICGDAIQVNPGKNNGKLEVVFPPGT